MFYTLEDTIFGIGPVKHKNKDNVPKNAMKFKTFDEAFIFELLLGNAIRKEGGKNNDNTKI